MQWVKEKPIVQPVILLHRIIAFKKRFPPAKQNLASLSISTDIFEIVFVGDAAQNSNIANRLKNVARGSGKAICGLFLCYPVLPITPTEPVQLLMQNERCNFQAKPNDGCSAAVHELEFS